MDALGFIGVPFMGDLRCLTFSMFAVALLPSIGGVVS